MAAINPDGIVTGTAIKSEEARGSFLGEEVSPVAGGTGLGAFKHVLVPFRTQLVDNNDTYDPGSATAGGNTTIGIAKVAWEPAATTDPVAVTITNSGRQVTFNSGSDDNVGTLHMWITS